MTTIVFDGKTLAGDSHEYSYSTLVDTDVTKIFQPASGEDWYIYDCKVLAFGLAGDGGAEIVVRHLLNEGITHDTEYPLLLEFSGIFVTKLWAGFVISKDNTNRTAMQLTPIRTSCIGSGRDIAKTAVYLGQGSVEAVELASKLDAYTGGKIQRYEVKQ